MNAQGCTFCLFKPCTYTHEAIIELYLCLSFNVTDPIPPRSHAASKIPILSLYHYTTHLVCKSMQIANYRRLQEVCKPLVCKAGLDCPLQWIFLSCILQLYIYKMWSMNIITVLIAINEYCYGYGFVKDGRWDPNVSPVVDTWASMLLLQCFVSQSIFWLWPAKEHYRGSAK